MLRVTPRAHGFHDGHLRLMPGLEMRRHVRGAQLERFERHAPGRCLTRDAAGRGHGVIAVQMSRSSVDFPDPFGPCTTQHSARGHFEIDAAQDVHVVDEHVALRIATITLRRSGRSGRRRRACARNAGASCFKQFRAARARMAPDGNPATIELEQVSHHLRHVAETMCARIPTAWRTRPCWPAIAGNARGCAHPARWPLRSSSNSRGRWRARARSAPAALAIRQREKAAFGELRDAEPA
jgi:hypothetical protein